MNLCNVFFFNLNGWINYEVKVDADYLLNIMPWNLRMSKILFE